MPVSWSIISGTDLWGSLGTGRLRDHAQKNGVQVIFVGDRL